MQNNEIDINIIISNSSNYNEIIQQEISKFNVEKYPDESIFKEYRKKGYNDPFGFYAFEDNKIIGGIVARKKMQWLDIDILFVNQNYRNNKIGTKLLNEAIKYCKKENLIGMHLYTLDFQAKGFYEKQGFELISQIKDWPKGFTRYEFIKYINC